MAFRLLMAFDARIITAATRKTDRDDIPLATIVDASGFFVDNGSVNNHLAHWIISLLRTKKGQPKRGWPRSKL
jgi:hypothetical protein